MTRYAQIVGLGMLLSVLVGVLAGCLPLPTIRIDLEVPPVEYRVAPARVQTQYVNRPGYPEASTPPEYNRALYLRYFLEGEDADSVIILVPGIYGGATSLDLLARELVAALPNTEVWAFERRANLLEDRSRIIESIKQRDPSIAYEYYIENYAQADGFKPLAPSSLDFMRRWTLEVHLEDLHRVVKEANERFDTVHLGGHSLGGSMVSYYAAYKVAEDQTGQEFVDSLVLIDGALGRTGGYGRAPEGLNLGSLELLPGVEGLEAGRGSPYLTFGLSPKYYATGEVAALLARFKPDDLTPPNFHRYPITNRASFGLSEDDHYAPTPIFGSSIGRVVNAELGGNIGAVLIGGRIGFTSQGVLGVADGALKVAWERGDEQLELTDIDVLAESWATADTNRSEWYFPLRLALDIGEHSVQLLDEPNFIPSSQVRLPTLAVGAERGLAATPEAFQAYNNVRLGSIFNTYIIPHHTHLDIVQAENNPLVALMKGWLESLDN